MEQGTLSKAVVTESGIITGLPDNFNQLSAKKQKQIVVECFRDNLIAINDADQKAEKLKEEAKLLTQRIRLSKEGKDLAKLKAEIKQLNKDINNLRAMRLGMLHITKKLGFDLPDELKKLKMVNG